ncbi:sigma-70 family RNA polymerase sigma factor [Paenibacillus anaericanus]|uniref:Sigma-70 family RNA polymerase sigma factor n=1 Tax=Paenibacillus anaericanus TaxID=170367 RepID=A0A3S1BK14_9BACL|nr:sigma-70 family RNA polymerase sigma factor [Paenibacillus anaericanus]RUT43004.1 sigma-70 family RNA polymerase sigma factor [Paenibacillus anaericanus]
MKGTSPNEVLLNKVCEEHLESVYNFCIYLIHNSRGLQDIAEESTQETFLEAKQQIEKLVQHPNIKGWLFQTAKNKVNRSFRYYYSKKKHELLTNEVIQYPISSIENELEINIDFDQLKVEVLKQLNAQEYELYCNYYLHKKSIDELSTIYDISRTAVTTRIYRLKKHIKEIANRVTI